jgi:hypothetical protein
MSAYNLKMIEVPEGLLRRVINRLNRERKLLTVKRRLAVFGVITLVSAGAFIPVWRLIESDFSNSGFWQFFSLLFSDWQAMTTYWQSFSLSLLEALPAMSLIAGLALLLVFLESLKFLVKNLKNFLDLKHLSLKYGQK